MIVEPVLAESATTVRAGPGEAGQRLDRMLALRLPALSRSRLKRLIESGRALGPEREVDMVAIPMRAVAPCPDAVLRGTRLRGRGGRATDPSSLS